MNLYRKKVVQLALRETKNAGLTLAQGY